MGLYRSRKGSGDLLRPVLKPPGKLRSDWRLPWTFRKSGSSTPISSVYSATPRFRVVPRPKKDDSAEVYIGEEFIGVLFVDDEDDDRSFQFQMAILEEDLAE